jgi:hypothetical protein
VSRRHSPAAATHRPHRHHTAYVNVVERAILRTRPLTDEQVRSMRDPAQAAVAAFVHGNAPWRENADVPPDEDMLMHWRNLADILNHARTFADMRLGSGEEVDRLLAEAGEVIGAILSRRDAALATDGRSVWSCTTDEHETLCWLVHLHFEVQCRACSLGEFERAYNRTRERIRQAIAGNASPGTVIVDPYTPVRAQA